MRMLRKISFSPETTEKERKQLIDREYKFWFRVLLIGFFVFLIGVILIILGVTGTVELFVQARELGGHLLNASPGLVIALGGITIIIVAICRGPDISYTKSSTIESPRQEVEK